MRDAAIASQKGLGQKRGGAVAGELEEGERPSGRSGPKVLEVRGRTKRRGSSQNNTYELIITLAQCNVLYQTIYKYYLKISSSISRC